MLTQSAVWFVMNTTGIRLLMITIYSPSHLCGDFDASFSSGDLLLESFLLSSLPLLKDLPSLERLLDLEESALLRLWDPLEVDFCLC